MLTLCACCVFTKRLLRVLALRRTLLCVRRPPSALCSRCLMMVARIAVRLSKALKPKRFDATSMLSMMHTVDDALLEPEHPCRQLIDGLTGAHTTSLHCVDLLMLLSICVLLLHCWCICCYCIVLTGCCVVVYLLACSSYLCCTRPL